MTTTQASRVAVTVEQAGPRARTVALVAAIAGAVTLVIRLALHVSGFDLYGDEIIYTNLGRSVISGGFPNFEGGIFFLHGPAFFYLEAGWARLVGSQPGQMSWVFAMRGLNALLAGATAVVVVLLGTRVSSLRVGAAAGALFAVDPFCIRQNDRVLLETSMMFWILLGYLVFIPLVGREPSRRDWGPAIGAGLLFGCAVLTKDEASLISVFPLLIAGIFGWGPRRAATLVTVAVAAAVYAVYVIVVAVNGHFRFFWETKTFGLQRMLGLVQITGFHSSGGGSLLTRLSAEANVFWSTYLVLLLAVPMMLLVLRRGSARPRMMALVYCAAALTMAYAVLFGTLEEQELYLLVVPSTLIIPLAAVELSALWRSRRPVRRGHPSRALASVMVVPLALVLGMNVFTCVQWLRQPDDAFVNLYRYVTTHVPRGTVIAYDGDADTPYSLYGLYQIGYWPTPAALSASHAPYLVVLWGSVTEGYSNLTTAHARQLTSRGRPLFSQWGRTNGQVVLYELPPAARPVRARHSRVRHRRHRAHTRKV
ncbi:MAG TPA: phospholipid carrier-dependent glycosyltransferase [Streptosporangiaceae bacterium]|nr:phospholipid carrier-dependent glycosyltransferase [Streptosporangiaceae bacterium]